MEQPQTMSGASPGLPLDAELTASCLQKDSVPEIEKWRQISIDRAVAVLSGR